MKNMNDLRDDQVNIYMEMREGKIGQSEAKTLATIAGRIISSTKTQMEYNKMSQSKKKIAFLEC